MGEALTKWGSFTLKWLCIFGLDSDIHTNIWDEERDNQLDWISNMFNVILQLFEEHCSYLGGGVLVVIQLGIYGKEKTSELR